MNFSIHLNDFNTICRICIFHNEGVELLDVSNSLKLLQECTSIDINEKDVLPQHICEECKNILEKFFTFRERCKQSDELFKKIVTEEKDHYLHLAISNNENIPPVDCKIESESEQLESHSVCTETEESQAVADYIKTKKILNIRKRKTGLIKENGSKIRKKIKRLTLDKSPGTVKIVRKRKRKRDPIFKCDKCDKGFAYPYQLRDHQFVHKEDRSYPCERCPKQFKRRIHLKQHNERCHDNIEREICNICGKLIKLIYMKRHMLYHEFNRSFKCPECDEVTIFKKKSRLKEHLKLVHNKLLQVHKYLCTICGKNMVSPRDLNNHMRVHTGERPFQCQQCDKNYKTSSSLHAHIKFTHNNERPHVCDVCQKGFPSRGKLERHQQTHATSKSHVCLVCGSAFGYISVLKTHMKIHSV